LQRPGQHGERVHVFPAGRFQLGDAQSIRRPLRLVHVVRGQLAVRVVGARAFRERLLFELRESGVGLGGPPRISQGAGEVVEVFGVRGLAVTLLEQRNSIRVTALLAAHLRQLGERVVVVRKERERLVHYLLRSADVARLEA
jgi:hypothetical protein